MRRVKIIATIGPQSETRDIITKLTEAGMDIARINFSHCTRAEFLSRLKIIKAVSRRLKTEVKILQDLQGPRIRVGGLPDAGVKLIEGQTVMFSTVSGMRGSIFIDHKNLHKEIHAGDPLYLSNGELKLVVRKIKGTSIFAEVERGGMLYPRKAVNVPHTRLSISGLTKKDIADLRFGLSNRVDYVALSFVQSAKDIEKARKIIRGRARIIAKIETAVALEHIDEIIRVTDGIMIARGDLGIEVPVEKLPFIQKNLVRHAVWHGKPAIIATQILMSMVDHPQPTRAEVSDLANAVFDGGDAVMLSDETASGKYPVRALKTAAKVIRQAEEYLNRSNKL